MRNNFFNANEAFEYLYHYIRDYGEDFATTRAIFNCGFYLDRPAEKLISNFHQQYGNVWLMRTVM